MNRKIWLSDDILFHLQGKNCQRFLDCAAQQKIRLAKLCREENGFTARVSGLDYSALQMLARKGGWKLSVVQRKGPGTMLEFLLRRPGILVGWIFFLVLLQQLTAFVWTIDFGTLDESQKSQMRELLASCQVWEGALLDQETLQKAQTLVLQQSDLFGWITLNFTDGCLWLESTPAEYQPIRQAAPLQPLYARDGGTVVSIQTESGFTAVKAGQSVEKGQLLVDVVRLDRDGKEIPQGASGTILARIEKSYTAFQPYAAEEKILTGQSHTTEQYTLLGHTWGTETETYQTEGILQKVWEPLRLGRICLPGVWRQQIEWQQADATVHYSEEQAQALARRDCRAQLLADYPDAAIEAEQVTAESLQDGQRCTIVYQFCANIASSAP